MNNGSLGASFWCPVALMVVCFLVLIFAKAPPKPDPAAMARTKRRADAQIVCPHCQVKGRVTTARTTDKIGISGGKAAAAVITFGFSVIATGLSQKKQITVATCGNCATTWKF